MCHIPCRALHRQRYSPPAIQQSLLKSLEPFLILSALRLIQSATVPPSGVFPSLEQSGPKIAGKRKSSILLLMYITLLPCLSKLVPAGV